MLRCFAIAVAAAVFATPLVSVTPASATVLVSCERNPAEDSFVGFSPQGLSHTPTAQEGSWFTWWDCGAAGTMLYRDANESPEGSDVFTYPPRPLGCPVAWGGAGPDYADQTPILLGPDPSGKAVWSSPSGTVASTGVAKMKAGPTSTTWRFVFNITHGRYAPSGTKKTKLKFTASFVPHPGSSYTCADDSDPLEYVQINSASSAIVQKK